MTTDVPDLLRALQVPIETLRLGPLRPVSVVIVDSGIDGSHQDLRDRMEAAYAVEVAAGGVVSVVPKDAAANNDAFGHGTAVGSIVARIAPNARLIDVRVLSGDNTGTGDALIAGLEHAVGLNASVINMSLAAAGKFLPRIAPLCDRAYRRSQTIVAARRNLPLHDQGYPAALIPCVGVANGGAGQELVWRFRDHVIEYEAHGIDLPAAAPGNAYTTVTGTSFATPVVAGLVAVLMGAYPDLRPFEIKALLKAFASPVEDEAPKPSA